MNTKLRIDLETGLMIDVVHPSVSGEDIIETPCLIPYHLPKWNGTEWVEGLSAEEIALIVNQPTEASIEDRVVTLELEQEQVIDLLAQALGV